MIVVHHVAKPLKPLGELVVVEERCFAGRPSGDKPRRASGKDLAGVLAPQDRRRTCGTSSNQPEARSASRAPTRPSRRSAPRMCRRAIESRVASRALSIQGGVSAKRTSTGPAAW